MASRAIWDKLGLVISMSVTWALCVLAPLSIVRWAPHSVSPVVRYAFLILIPIFGAVPAAGSGYIAQEIACFREVSYESFLREGWRLRWESLRLSFVHWIFFLVMGVTIWFYLHISHWSGRIGLLFCFYFSICWCLMSVCHFPIMVAQETGAFDEPGRRAKRGTFAVIRRSFFLLLGRPLFVLGLFSVLALFTTITLVTAILPILLWSGCFSFLTAFPIHALLIQFDVIRPPEKESAVAPAR